MPFVHFHRFRGPLFAAATLAVGGWGSLAASEQEGDDPAALSRAFPLGIEPVSAANFDALLSHSPFLRSLDLSGSITLTGIANIGGDLFVTLFKKDTKETQIVSASSNIQGMRLVSVDGNQADLDTVTAQISLASGEVFAVRFEEQQLKPGEGKPATSPGGASSQTAPVADYRQGVSGDGFPGPPPPELVKKLSQLSEDQRNRVIKEIREIRDKKQTSSQERQVLFTRMVDRALQEKS